MSVSWKKVSSKQILDHKRLAVFVDEVELPSGHHTDYLHFGNNGDSCEIIAINDQGKFFMQKEYNYPPNEWLFQFPGGKLEKSEDPALGAKRELKEEGGLIASLQKIGSYYRDCRRHSGVCHVFIGNVTGFTDKKPDLEEDFEDFWFTESEIDTMIRDQQVRNHSLLAAWSFYKAK